MAKDKMKAHLEKRHGKSIFDDLPKSKMFTDSFKPPSDPPSDPVGSTVFPPKFAFKPMSDPEADMLRGSGTGYVVMDEAHDMKNPCSEIMTEVRHTFGVDVSRTRYSRESAIKAMEDFGKALSSVTSAFDGIVLDSLPPSDTSLSSDTFKDLWKGGCHTESDATLTLRKHKEAMSKARISELESRVEHLKSHRARVEEQNREMRSRLEFKDDLIGEMEQRIAELEKANADQRMIIEGMREIVASVDIDDLTFEL